ncbi:MAG: DUF1116 domain-containing protein [Bacillota bacterium]
MVIRLIALLMRDWEKVLRFGAYSADVIEHLSWMEKEISHLVLKQALEIHGEIDLKSMIDPSPADGG